ncbi:MAG: VOC family protein [Armatimonadota bacterium]
MSRVVHFEIGAKNPETIIKFYQEALGWEINAWEGGDYWLVTTGERDTPGIDGGIMPSGFPQPVINTIAVDSLDDTIARIEAAGGKKVYGPQDIPGIGRHAYCADPEGTWFGVLQPSGEMS